MQAKPTKVHPLVWTHYLLNGQCSTGMPNGELASLGRYSVTTGPYALVLEVICPTCSTVHPCTFVGPKLIGPSCSINKYLPSALGSQPCLGRAMALAAQTPTLDCPLAQVPIHVPPGPLHSPWSL